MSLSDARIAANVQRLRGSVTQAQVAEQMKARGHRWSQPTVVAVEKGERALRLNEAVDLADILGRSMSLFTAPDVDLELATERTRLAARRADLESAVERYEGQRIYVLHATLDAWREGYSFIGDSRDAWAAASPESVIAEMRETKSDQFFQQEWIDEYLAEVNAAG